MLPIQMLPAYKTLQTLRVNRRGWRGFNPEHGATLVERGYAQIQDGRLFITEAGKQAARQGARL